MIGPCDSIVNGTSFAGEGGEAETCLAEAVGFSRAWEVAYSRPRRAYISETAARLGARYERSVRGISRRDIVRSEWRRKRSVACGAEVRTNLNFAPLFSVQGGA